MRKELSKGSLFHNLDRTINLDDEKSIQLVCSRVAEWAASAVLEDTLDLDSLDICQGDIRLSYVIHKELRQRFPDIWSFPEGGLVSVSFVSHLIFKGQDISSMSYCEGIEPISGYIMDSFFLFFILY